MIRRAPALACLAIGFVLALAGCGKKLPQLTEAGGVVLLDNEPLPFALVQFMPELSEFGAEYNSRATTDEQGKFTLVCNKTGEPGAVIGWQRVIVVDSTPRPCGAKVKRRSSATRSTTKSSRTGPFPPSMPPWGRPLCASRSRPSKKAIRWS